MSRIKGISNDRVAMLSTRIKVRSRVQILRKDIHHLKHSKQHIFGRVKYIDGSYIYVQPFHCKWVIELYPNEVKLWHNNKGPTQNE